MREETMLIFRTEGCASLSCGPRADKLTSRPHVSGPILVTWTGSRRKGSNAHLQAFHEV